MSARNKSEYSSIRKNEIQQYDLSGLAEKILANAGVGIYVIQDGSFVYVSELYQRMTGFDKMEIIGKRSMDFIFPADREKVRVNAVRCLKMDVHEPYTYRFIRKDKEIMWVMETITSIEYHGKRAALGSFMDITEHRLAEDKLRREEQIFRIITDQSSDMIILMDLEGRILYINQVVEKLLGFKPGEAIGIKGFENIHPEDMPFFKEQFYLLTKIGMLTFCREKFVFAIEMEAIARLNFWGVISGIMILSRQLLSVAVILRNGRNLKKP